MRTKSDARTLARSIADGLVADAICDGGLATWLGDDKRSIDGQMRTVHVSMDGDLYAGTAGVGWFLARAFVTFGDIAFRDASLAALRFAERWCERTRADAALYTGSIGVAATMASCADWLDEPSLRSRARRLTEIACARPARSFDFLGGLAGSIVGLLAIDRILDHPKARNAAVRAGDALLDSALRRPFPGASWSDELGQEAPLCGLAHGASGVAVACVELAAATGDERFVRLAADASEYERAWYRSSAGGWPDLREVTRAKLASGEQVECPALWCHGAVGIGLARLRQFERSRVGGDSAEFVATEFSAAESAAAESAAAEAEAALIAAERSLAVRLEDEAHRDVHVDGSMCHGLAGLAELFLEGARVFGRPRLEKLARACGHLIAEAAQDGDRAWPCGVSEAGENASLMLGVAGIGAHYLRLADTSTPPIGLPFMDRTS